MFRAGRHVFPSSAFSAALACALALLSMGRTEHAFAQELPAAVPKEDDAYRAAVRDALLEYDARHFEEARTLFRRAHDIEPNARTLRGIGMASFELRDYVVAVRALSAALVDTRKALTPEQREHTQGLLERSELFIDVFVLKSNPPDARVVIDGQSPEPEPDGTILLGFGSHIVEASKPGYLVRTFPIKVHGGERRELIVNLEHQSPPPMPPPSPVVPSPVAPVLPAAPTPEAPSASAGWYWGAGGAALLAGAAAAWWGFEDARLRSCRNSSDGLSCDKASAIETKRNLAIAGTALAGTAAATMAVIGVLRRKIVSDAGAERSLSCVVIPTGISCAKSF
jgi:tetratricopeptide (TPR) repeat protein